MPEEISLDEINISSAAHTAWQEVARRIGEMAFQLGISPREIPDEKARIEDDGSLTISVELPFGEVALRVPPAQWARRFPKNYKGGKFRSCLLRWTEAAKTFVQHPSKFVNGSRILMGGEYLKNRLTIDIFSVAYFKKYGSLRVFEIEKDPISLGDAEGKCVRQSFYFLDVETRIPPVL